MSLIAPSSSGSSEVDLLGVSPPEHGILGRALVVLIHCLAPSVALAWMASGPWVRGELWLVALFCLIAIPWGACLAESLRRFECWAWFFMVPLLGVGIFVVSWGITESAPREAMGLAGLCVPLVAWFRYLWTHRRQFWADPPSRASRLPERRWITPEWRAARLARIRSAASPPRLEPSSVSATAFLHSVS